MTNRRTVALLLALGGCGHHATTPDAGVDMAFAPAFAAHDKVDILFLIENDGTAPYQGELRNRFPQFVKALQTAAANGHPASYHIGVVTSDLGAGPEVLNQGQCHPGGDGGKLQVVPPASSMGVPAACSNLSLAGGVRFLDYDQINGTSNFTGVPDLPTAFACISDVGDAGCGFQHLLESPYRALHDDIPENAGFLRDDALLVVFFLADEDDCSAPPDTDLFDPSANGIAKYGVLHDFRCIQFGISCTTPPMPLQASTGMGPLFDCAPLAQAEGGKLFDVQRYLDFFTRPGGVKPDPSDVILASIAGPPTPFGWMTTSPCSDQVNTPSCPIVNASCVAPTNGAFFADPAVRLTTVVSAAQTSVSGSACDTDYSPALDAMAQAIIARLP